MERAIEKTHTCPFCGEKSLFIGVHDDEGNYHGPLGCEYEQDPWSGLSYALHHDGWGECILCTGGTDDVMGGILFDTAQEAVDAMPTLTQSNEWIGVEDKLPGVTGKYIACVKDNRGARWTICADWSVEMKSWFGEFGEIKNKVTHWMPLPEPPESRATEGERKTNEV